jgi:hypothetical protein
MDATIQITVLVLGAIFAGAGIALFAKRGISGQNTIKVAGMEFQLAGSSLVVFVVGCGLIVVATRLPTVSTKGPKEPAPSVPPAVQGTPPEFTTQHVYPPEKIERTEYLTEPGAFPADTIDSVLRVTRIAFGQDGQGHQIFQVSLALKNTTKEPIVLDLTERFFSLADDTGRTATLLYFCCASAGDLLSPGEEREINLFFQSSGWVGKGVTAQHILLRVQGLLPVVRGTWRFPTLATAD